jgi:cytochrome oxidase Cu insertion factor (SCO1/SenC/PrrC family)
VVVLAPATAAGETCPDLVPALAGAARDLGAAAGRQVFFVLLGVDPVGDSPTRWRQAARARGLAPAAWVLLSGRAEQVAVVTARYGLDVRVEDGRVRHPCVAFLVDRRGVLRGRLAAPSAAEVLAAVQALLAEGDPPGVPPPGAGAPGAGPRAPGSR